MAPVTQSREADEDLGRFYSVHTQAVSASHFWTLGGNTHTHTHMKTTYTIGLWGYVCLSDQGLEPSYLHIFSLINYLGVPDVLKYTLHHVSVCAHEQILSMLYMYVWTHIWAGYCRCDGGSICESVC